MVPSPRRSFTAQPALVLKDVVAELVRENVRDHESSQACAGPRHDAITIGDRTCGAQTRPLLRREIEPQPPRRQRLVVKDDSARLDQSTQRECLEDRWGRNEINGRHPVVRLLAEASERVSDLGGGCWMVTAGARRSRTDDRKRRPSNGADAARVGPQSLRQLPSDSLTRRTHESLGGALDTADAPS